MSTIAQKKWDKLLHLLQQHSLSQQDLADEFDVSERTVRRWLNDIETKYVPMGMNLSKHQDPKTNVFYYGVYDTLPKQKHLPRKHTFKTASDGSPYIIVMIPDKIGGGHQDFGNHIKITGVGDVHYGHRACQKDKFLKMISVIAEEPNHYWFCGADLTENSGRHSIGGGVYDQLISPQQQQDEIIEIIRPIAHKCFFMSNGNHGYRSYKEVGLDPDMNIAKAFDIPYYVGQYHMDVNWNGNIWSMVGYHGKGKGSAPKSRLDALIRTAKLNEVADFHVMFHMHHRMNMEFVVPTRNRREHTLDDKKTRAVLFGGFLEYWREYCDIAAMDKTFVGTYSLVLCEDGRTKLFEQDL